MGSTYFEDNKMGFGLWALGFGRPGRCNLSNCSVVLLRDSRVSKEHLHAPEKQVPHG